MPENVMANARALVPVLLALLAHLDDQDPVTQRAVLRRFGIEESARRGQRAVQVACAVASVRFARRRAARTERQRIESILREVDGGA